MEEHGIVIAREGDKVTVKVEGSDSCKSCSCRGFCMMGEDGSVQILAEDFLGAQEGDMVTVTLGEGRKIAGTAIVFLTPIVGMFVGLFVGLAQSGAAGSVVGAIVGCAVGFAVLWILDRVLTRGATFRPKVTLIHNTDAGILS